MTLTFRILREFLPRASLLLQKYLCQRQGTLLRLSCLSRQKRIRLQTLDQSRVNLTVLRVDPCLQILNTTDHLCDLRWVGGALI